MATPAERAVDRLLARADTARSRSRFAVARDLLQQALAIATTAGPRSPLVAAVHNQFGILGKATGDFAGAAQHYRTALRIVERAGPHELLELADLYHNLGGLAHARGRYREGEPWARKAVIQRARRHGGNATITWLDRTAHAALLDGLGRHAASEHIYRTALPIFRRRFGPGHYEVAVTLNNLACACAEQGRVNQATRYLRKSVLLKERLFGARSVEVAITLNNLATVVAQGSRPGEATPLLTRALAILTQRLGTRHPAVQSCRQSLRRVGGSSS